MYQKFLYWFPEGRLYGLVKVISPSRKRDTSGVLGPDKKTRLGVSPRWCLVCIAAAWWNPLRKYIRLHKYIWYCLTFFYFSGRCWCVRRQCRPQHGKGHIGHIAISQVDPRSFMFFGGRLVHPWWRPRKINNCFINWCRRGRVSAAQLWYSERHWKLVGGADHPCTNIKTSDAPVD